MSSRAGRDAESSDTRSEEAGVWKNQLRQSPGEQNGAFFPKTERWPDSPSASTQAMWVNPWGRGEQWPGFPSTSESWDDSPVQRTDSTGHFPACWVSSVVQLDWFSGSSLGPPCWQLALKPRARGFLAAASQKSASSQKSPWHLFALLNSTSTFYST